MSVYREERVDIELNTGTVYRSFLNKAICKGDNLGNVYGMSLYRGGEPVDLTGATCMGIFINPRGEHILINGNNAYVEGNVALVKLPQACYNYVGQFTLSIKVIDAEATETMRIIDGTVVETGVDNAVAPVGAVPTYQEILALYEQMVNIAGVAKASQGEGNANQVDGYHAADLLVDINGTKQQLCIRTGGDNIPDDVVTTFDFSPAFPNACIGVSVMPQTGFNVLSELSIESYSSERVQIKQKNGQGLGMNVQYVAFGY